MSSRQKCDERREPIAALVLGELSASAANELRQHITTCEVCSGFYEALTQEEEQVMSTFEAITHDMEATKHTLVQSIQERTVQPAPWLTQVSRQVLAAVQRMKAAHKAAALAGLAALLLLVASLFLSSNQGPVEMPALTFIREARAAEAQLFAGEGIVSVVTEIIVKPVSNADLARVRWCPVVSIEASGTPRFHQLSLPAEPGEGYTVQDRTWYDPATGRFVRLLTAGERPVFANSYDGGSVYSLETDAKGAVRIVKSPVTQDFRPPESPAGFLGMTAGLGDLLKRKDESLVLLPGDVTLDDGSEARVVKAGPPPGGPEQQTDTYWLFKIRKKDDLIAESEWLAAGESMLVLRRVEAKKVEAPGVPWNLAGIRIPAAEAEERPTLGVTPDMVVSDVSVQHMLEKAPFETYIFGPSPSWTHRRDIIDILDIVSPPHRMFAVAYEAEDGRHVVLVEAHTYNVMLGPMAKEQGTLVYTSPTGVKVWSGARDKWLAGILLQSARAVIRVSPAEDRTGYLLETPAGTFPALAVNGPVSDAELHALIDSLIPAKEYVGE